jgi:tRNA pseudouridine55 synthase
MNRIEIEPSSTENPDLILNIRKPVGWTSNDVIRWCKRRWPNKKVGHAGTLDPFAEGVLLVCIGRATRNIIALMSQEKEYLAHIQLGIETDTLDVTGQIISQKKVSDLSAEQIEQAGVGFIGEIEQEPPKFSAIQIDGQRCYKMARNGRAPVLEKRTVHIYRLESEKYKADSIMLHVVCSKGTYMRSLGRDLAATLGTVGFVRMLTRKRIGEYQLTDSLEVLQIMNGIV